MNTTTNDKLNSIKPTIFPLSTTFKQSWYYKDTLPFEEEELVKVLVERLAALMLLLLLLLTLLITDEDEEAAAMSTAFQQPQQVPSYNYNSIRLILFVKYFFVVN